MTECFSGARVLVVDDDEDVRRLFTKLLGTAGYVVDAACDGPSALEAVARNLPDVILLDVVMPGIDGFAVCRHLKADSLTRLTPVVLVTGLEDRKRRLEGVEAGADDFLTKPVDSHELLARVRALVRLKRYTDDLDSATSILMALASMIESRDGCSEGHCHRMANYASAIGRRLGLGDDELQVLHRGGFLHDIGMLAMPATVMRQPSPLSADDYTLIKSHTVIGDALCANLRSLQAVRPIVRHHHERRDGSGYPDGLCGDAIPLTAQIIGIVDVYEAVTAPQSYQTARSSMEAVVELRRQVEQGWRRHDLVEYFAAIVQTGKLDRFSDDNSQPSAYCMPTA
jgi:putative two-component system response regulator